MEEQGKHRNPNGVGAQLRTYRQKRGDDLRDVARLLCIRLPYLEAIEEGRLDELPGPTYAIGFVRAYADHLGLDSDEAVRRFKAESSTGDGAAELHFPSPVSQGGGPKTPVILAGVAIAAIAYAGWHVISTREDLIADLTPPVPERLMHFLSGEEPSDPPPPSPTDSETRTAAASETSAPAVAEAEKSQHFADSGGAPSQGAPDFSGIDAATGNNDVDPTASEPPNPGVGEDDASATASATEVSGIDSAIEGASEQGRILIRATQETWVQIREGQDRILLTRLFKAGDEYRVPDRPDLKLVTGNAGGLEIIVDGEAIPPLGGAGVVQRNVALNADALRSGSAVPR